MQPQPGDFRHLQVSARTQLESKARSSKSANDEFYTTLLCLRSEPVTTFFDQTTTKWILPIFSINEDTYLKELGLSADERNQMEGLVGGRRSHSDVDLDLNEEQQTTRAVVKLAANPPQEVGAMQRLTSRKLLRPFPLGLRMSGKNMSPLPCWLGGGQHVCLNFSHNDLSVQLHFALFNGSAGFVLKPAEMNAPAPMGDTDGSTRSTQETSQRTSDVDAYWPPPRDWLYRVSIHVLSLHNLPKHGEQRPRLDGRRSAAHRCHPELSGSTTTPNKLGTSAPALSMSLHPFGGFCAISGILPLPIIVNTEVTLSHHDNGMNAPCGKMVYCVAAEPHATILRIGVKDRKQGLVAYESAVLGRLRGGHRVFQLRSLLGTRIEICYLFVRITFGRERNLWPTPRQMRYK